MNLLDETLAALKQGGKDAKTVTGVSICPGYWVGWAEFCVVAARCNYDSDEGHEVLPTLKVLGDGWWLEREYHTDYLYSDWVLRELPRQAGYNRLKPLQETDLVFKGR